MHILDLDDYILEYIRFYLSRRPLSYNYSNHNYSFYLLKQCQAIQNPKINFVPLQNEKEFDLDLEQSYFDDVEEDFNWKRFVDTSKQLSNLKKKSIYITLNTNSCLRFLNDIEFQRRVLSQIVDPRRQLRIVDYSNNLESIEEFSNKNFSLLNGINYLIFSIPAGIKTFDFSVFRSIKIISLIDCPGIRKLSHLNQVHTLELLRCSSLEEISDCSELKELYLCECDRLESISAEILDSLKEFRVASCPLLEFSTTTSFFEKLHQIWICDYEFPDYSLLKNIPRITINDINTSFSISTFRSVQVLVLESCTSLTTLASLPFLRKCLLFSCGAFTTVDFASLPFLTDLEIDDCHTIQELSVISPTEDSADIIPCGLQYLTVRDCPKLKNIKIIVNSLKRAMLINNLDPMVGAGAVFLSVKIGSHIPRILTDGRMTTVMNFHTS
jgi:hypothetical protein